MSKVAQLSIVVAFHFGHILVCISLTSPVFFFPFIGPRFPTVPPCFPYPLRLNLLAYCCPTWVAIVLCCTPKRSIFNSMWWEISVKVLIFSLSVSTSFPYDSSKGHITTVTCYLLVRLLPTVFKSRIRAKISLKCSAMMCLGSIIYCSDFKVSTHNLVIKC